MSCHESDDAAEATSPVDESENDTSYQPSERERMIREKQALQTERYNQLLDLMNKSDLFVKMIFQRIEEANKKADKKVQRIRKREAKGNLKRQASPVKSGPAKRRRKVVETHSDDDDDDDESDKEEETNEEERVVEKLFTGGTLRDYQVEGRNWLNNLYENALSGILGDEMGLGKTVQIISSVAHMIENGVEGPFFIIVPLSTLDNWEKEFHRFTPKIPVLVYYSTESASCNKVNRHKMIKDISRVHKISANQRARPVVITTYDVARVDAGLLRHINWKMLVVDEGHRLKNHNCLLLKALRRLNCSFRVLLTGTPLQNNLSELWSLLNFVLPEIFNKLSTFEQWLDPKSMDEEEIMSEHKQKGVVSLMHQILTPFLLRRLKADVELNVPPKREVIVYAPLAPRQRELYERAVDVSLRRHARSMGKKECVAAFLQNEEIPIEEEEKKPLERQERKTRPTMLKDFGSDDSEDEIDFFKNMVNERARELHKEALKKQVPPKWEQNVKLSHVVPLLRKVCNHSHMVEYPLDEFGEYAADERLISCSGKMQVMDKLLKLLKKNGHKVLIFSQFTSMLDIIQDYLNYVGYKYSRLDGAMGLEERRDQLTWFAADSDIFAFLLSTRAGGLGLNIIQADTVIFFDSDWNPQCDIQAQDRCHRIGQTKPVLIMRLVVANTLDEAIIERAQAKRTLERLIIHNKQFKKSVQSRQEWESVKKNTLTNAELLDIFSSKDYRKANDKVDSSDENLLRVLDRSDMWATMASGEESRQSNGIHENGAVDLSSEESNGFKSQPSTKKEDPIEPSTTSTNKENHQSNGIHKNDVLVISSDESSNSESQHSPSASESS